MAGKCTSLNLYRSEMICGTQAQYSEDALGVTSKEVTAFIVSNIMQFEPMILINNGYLRSKSPVKGKKELKLFSKCS